MSTRSKRYAILAALVALVALALAAPATATILTFDAPGVDSFGPDIAQDYGEFVSAVGPDAVQSVTTFWSFLYEFSSFVFDSWAAVVIIERWPPRLAIYADRTIAFVSLSDRPATSNRQSSEAFLAPQLTGGSTLPGPKWSPLTSRTWTPSVFNRNC